MNFLDFKNKSRELLNFYLSTVKQYKFFAYTFHIVCFLIILSILIYLTSFRAPKNFIPESLFTIEQGQTLSETAELLEEQNIIRSAFWFKKLVIVLRGEGHIKAGDYFFKDPQGAYDVARRMVNGDFDLTPIKTTIFEGLNVFEIADTLEKHLPEFDKEEFIRIASKKEGYLFPDTYLFSPTVKPKDIVSLMEDNFEMKIKSIEKDLREFGKPIDEVMTMASIIETESGSSENRKTISGILWKRLEINMPLQVDVTFKYINGKNSYELTSEDLKTDSPYNTYTNSGLPPTPIANPGLDAILATIQPEDTDYLYFLSDKSGNMYYAKTHNEHVENKRLYLHNW